MSKTAAPSEQRVPCSAAAGDEQRVFWFVFDLMDGDEVRRRIKLVPLGTFKLRDGRGPFTLTDAAHAAAIIAATVAHAGSQDMMVDYDHQSEFGAVPGVGGQAPASGWIKPETVAFESDGIWADVEWTAPAEARIKAREYRYISPLFGADKTTGRITRLFNVGLVNQPAIDGLPAIAAQLLPGESMKNLAKLLGLSEDATEEQIAAAIAALQADKVQLVAAAKVLGLKDDAKGEEVVAAAKAKAEAASPDPKKFVPIAGLEAVQAQLNLLNEGRAAAAIDRAVEEGRIQPALKDWAKSLFLKDEASFTAMVEKAAPVLGAGKKLPATPDSIGGGEVVLTDEDKAACSLHGWDEKEFLESKKANL